MSPPLDGGKIYSLEREIFITKNSALERLLRYSDGDGDWQSPLMTQLQYSNHQSHRPEVQRLIEELLVLLNEHDECIFTEVYTAELQTACSSEIFEKRLNADHRDIKGLVSQTGRRVTVILKERGNEEQATRRMERRFNDACEYTEWQLLRELRKRELLKSTPKEATN